MSKSHCFKDPGYKNKEGAEADSLRRPIVLQEEGEVKGSHRWAEGLWKNKKNLESSYCGEERKTL